MFDLIPNEPQSNLTHLDCFCGAGIGEVGAKKAGLKTVAAFDNNKWAVRSFNHNFGNIAFQLDANTLEKTNDTETFEHIRSLLPSVDIVSGGFPCKPWSIVGAKLGAEDKKTGNLGQIMAKIIRATQPKAFLIENVDGLVNSRNIKYFMAMIEYLEASGYSVKWTVLNASDYGVAQNRKRVFIIGFRLDIGCDDYAFPEPTTPTSESKISIRTALKGLPMTPNGINDHHGVGLRNDEKPYAHKIPIGGNWKDLPIDDQKAFMKKGFYSSGGRTGSLYKVNPDKQAKTILSSPLGKVTAQILDWGDGVCRRYTVRESLRLQSVPDSFSFVEEMPLMKKYERCSGIPSLLAYYLFKSISDKLKVANTRQA